MWNFLKEKVELQSIIVFLMVMFGGIFLIVKAEDNNFSNPKIISGLLLLISSILFAFISFFTNQVKENFKDIINELKSIIENQKSNQKYMEGSYKKYVEFSKNNSFGDYTPLKSKEDETKSS